MRCVYVATNMNEALVAHNANSIMKQFIVILKGRWIQADCTTNYSRNTSNICIGQFFIHGTQHLHKIKNRYSLRPILLLTNTDVSTTKILVPK
jgi:hypothetical protein